MTPAERRRLDALIQAEAHERDENLHGFRNLLALLVGLGAWIAGYAWLMHQVVTGQNSLAAVVGAAVLMVIAVVVWIVRSDQR